MSHWQQWFRERRSADTDDFLRGKPPEVSLELPPGRIQDVLIGGVVIAVIIAVIVWKLLDTLHVASSGNIATTVFGYVLFGTLLWPFLVCGYLAVRYKAPFHTAWRSFPESWRWVASATLAVFLVGIFNVLLGHVLTAGGTLFFAWPGFTIGTYVTMHKLSREKPDVVKPFVPGKVTASLPFGLWIGESTGWLAKLWHSANMARGQQITLSLEDAAQNILVLGAIGSGKTTRAMHGLLVQLLEQDCGGLIFDIKGDFKNAVTTFAAQAKREPVIIGINRQPLNLLAGLTPELAASFLKSALLLGGSGKNDSFWIDTATELCRNVLGVLCFVPDQYHLNGLYRYLFDQEFKNIVNDDLQLKALETSEQRRLDVCQRYIDSIFAGFDDKVKSGVMASVAQILSPFQHPDLVDAFCAMESVLATEGTDEASSPTQKPSYRMEDVLDGTLYLVDMPLSQWGMAGKVIYTMLKLRFFNVMQQRALHPEWNQARPVFFMCDEYQEIVSCNKDGLSDLNFWDKSRSSKTIGIISAQSVSSFYAAIGNRDLVHALLQNFRQKIIFRTEDDWTISYCNRIISKVDTRQLVEGSGTSSSNSFHGDSTSTSSSQTISIQQRDVVDGQLFRNLAPDQALALLSLKGYAADDVLNVVPVFV